MNSYAYAYGQGWVVIRIRSSSHIRIRVGCVRKGKGANNDKVRGKRNGKCMARTQSSVRL